MARDRVLSLFPQQFLKASARIATHVHPIHRGVGKLLLVWPGTMDCLQAASHEYNTVTVLDSITSRYQTLSHLISAGAKRITHDTVLKCEGSQSGEHIKKFWNGKRPLDGDVLGDYRWIAQLYVPEWSKVASGVVLCSIRPSGCWETA
jgi:hypothetical protein